MTQRRKIEVVRTPHPDAERAAAEALDILAEALADRVIERARQEVGVRKEMERVEKFLHAHYRDRKLPMETLTIQDESFSFLEIPRALERGEVLAMLADRKWGDKFVSCPILGKEAQFPAGPFQLAAITGAPIVSWFVMKDDPDTYHFYATAPIEVPRTGRKDREKNIREAVGRYVANIEWILGKYPLQWYNFYDFWEEGLEQ